MSQGREGPLLFPPQVAVEVKALACQLPSEFDKPLSRFTAREIAQLAMERGIAASISGTTVWRWLSEDAIKPWQYRSWIFPRDPIFSIRPGVFWTYIIVSGMASHLTVRNMSSVLTRKPVFRRVIAFMKPHAQARPSHET